MRDHIGEQPTTGADNGAPVAPWTVGARAEPGGSKERGTGVQRFAPLSTELREFIDRVIVPGLVQRLLREAMGGVSDSQEVSSDGVPWEV